MAVTVGVAVAVPLTFPYRTVRKLTTDEVAASEAALVLAVISAWALVWVSN